MKYNLTWAPSAWQDDMLKCAFKLGRILDGTKRPAGAGPAWCPYKLEPIIF